MNCSLLNRFSVRAGEGFIRIQSSATDRASARTRPSSGDRMIAAEVWISPFAMIASQPALASAAPTRPPTRACDEDEGMPNHQVMMFQEMAPHSAPKTTALSMADDATIPEPTVFATCSPKNRNATKLKKAAQATAACGVSSRVETISAIELAASWKPFMKSNSSATTTSSAITSRPCSLTRRPPRDCSYPFENDAVDDVGCVFAAVDGLLEQFVELLGAD